VPVRRLTLGEARAMLADETLGRGSMRPKMEAAVEFVEQGVQRAVIAHLEQGVEALAGQTGTTIVEDGST
jgi:carbamate kinase